MIVINIDVMLAKRKMTVGELAEKVVAACEKQSNFKVLYADELSIKDKIATIAKDYTDSLYRTLGHVALISDRDAVVSSSGASKRERSFAFSPVSTRYSSASPA